MYVELQEQNLKVLRRDEWKKEHAEEYKRKDELRKQRAESCGLDLWCSILGFAAFGAQVLGRSESKLTT